MSPPGGRPSVSIARGHPRRDGVRRALELLAPELAACVRGTIVIKPNLGCGYVPKQYAASHVDGARGVLDVVRDFAPRRVLIAEGGQATPEKFDLFGYRSLVREYGVELVDLNRESRWSAMRLQRISGGSLTAGVSRTVLEADCRISLALPKTHDLVVASLSLKNMMGCIKRDECKFMHGTSAAMWWHRYVPKVLRAAVRAYAPGGGQAIKRRIARLQRIISRVSRTTFDPRFEYPAGRRPPAMIAELSHVLSVNLAVLAASLPPTVSVIDGYSGLEGEGPTAGDPIDLGVVVAGTDFVAADATMARIMGFDPRQIEYLHLTAQSGLGVLDEAAIDLRGDIEGSASRPFRPHPDVAGQFAWCVE